MTPPPKILRCAIYTRKSSEEGLEQDFNSLHAQREAGEAFVKSQKHEGWQVIKTSYDDGGYSGGTMQRPALQQLLGDIVAGKIDVIVVYKVDRLSRSLHDFAKMVEIFDKHGVSFVSVTQQFNTTTSMGRLTLNMLLSFAQFEREVTGERIRDKIAASKKKGIWMGGPVPLGYEVADRKLIVKPEEAKAVQHIFQRYLELGCVRLLAEEISRDQNGIFGKARKFSRGHLYTLLSNPIYAGQIRHKGTCYPGLHEAIIDQALWDQVQQRLRDNVNGEKLHSRNTAPSMLMGKLFDASGDRLSPSHATKQGRRYRYYVSQNLKLGTAEKNQHGWRLPAHEFEQIVFQGAKAMLADRSAITNALQESGIENHRLPDLLKVAKDLSQHDNTDVLAKLINRVELRRGTLRIVLSLASLISEDASLAPTIACEIPMLMRRRGAEMRLVIDPEDPLPKVNNSLVKAIARAHRWFGELASGKTASITAIASREGIDKGYVSHLINLAFLAPDITEAIIAGQQPAGISVHTLIKDTRLPVEWPEQHRMFGFAERQR